MGVLKNIGIGLDQTLNCCIRINKEWGTPDEMLSARAYRIRDTNPKYEKIINTLFFWDKDHCLECYKIEQNRDQFPDIYKT